jgi:hypothetical protein
MTATTTLERSPTGVGASIINGYTARGSARKSGNPRQAPCSVNFNLSVCIRLAALCPREVIRHSCRFTLLHPDLRPSQIGNPRRKPILQMTPELAKIFASFRPSSKTDARCGPLP